MDTIVKARLVRIEARLAQLEGRVRDVEDVQHDQLKKSDRVERSLHTVLTCLRRQGDKFDEFRNQTERALRIAISAASAAGSDRKR